MAVEHRRGFTLVELLVVVGIIAVLLSLLMPATYRARRQANTVVCLGNLRQLAMAFHGYVTENKGRAPYKHHGPLGLFIPPNDTTTFPEVVFCPEARDVGRLVDGGQIDAYEGSAHRAWGMWYARPPAINVPWWGLRSSSYGRNFWTCSPTPYNQPEWEPLFVSPRTAQAGSVPLFADACSDDPMPSVTDTPPRNLTTPNIVESGRGIAMRTFCISRHGRAINIVFLDGHATTTPLEELWKLKWHNQWVPTDVTLPAR
jgi:prepilin-type N-terminal cleavage/methylation domain-containing protein/prepilin-type processing-associated H-X9-DG protein